MRYSKIVPGAALALAAFVTQANANNMIYCQGKLATTVVAFVGTVVLFTWSSSPAGGATPPGAGQCAWPDRLPSDKEKAIKYIGGFTTSGVKVAAGAYGKICVKVIDSPAHLAKEGYFKTPITPPFPTSAQPC